MSNTIITKDTYGQWGECLFLTNGTVELVVTLDLGPRIIRFGFNGEENLLLEDTEAKIRQDGEQFDVFGGGGWKLYGGHRLWTSPEASPRTYYPDNNPVSYELIENGAIFTADVEQWNGVQKTITIQMNPTTGEVTIDHKIVNVNAWPIELAPWAITVMSTDGTAIIPQTSRETGFLPNRIVSLWPYSKMNDPRVTWGDKFIFIQQDPTEKDSFKLGTNNEAGWAAYYKNNSLFVKYHNHDINVTYPDHNVSFECYTNDIILELESLGALQTLQPQEACDHQEKWALIRVTEDLPITDQDLLEQKLKNLI
ncbi:hypothetical protein NV379_11180 [Paenibacillus sp. N1-5-1-14]|uniref:hypothetical protein n=1 Tax=Paenibacillus radicibacter TaxID=2972488 RepID=UPI00215984A3|nr:hypothetical protein [Paenibacillus radicibacter]MCR8643223.1 hypothetical protein [Paenibacillus radicibacter]